MTKDLAICVKGSSKVERTDYRTTQEFLGDIKTTLEANWATEKAKL